MLLSHLSTAYLLISSVHKLRLSEQSRHSETQETKNIQTRDHTLILESIR